MTSKRRGNNKERRGREERRFTVRGIRRDPPDIRKLSKALLGLAMAMAEAELEAQAQQAARQPEAKAASSDTEVRQR
ncbi:hypothetical protein [Streptomyces griseorubiginosus]|uniref:hypothetical protein n=1 Tax=Streptomyces griseorubiginosus TaxID=67304 RepID=UPI002E81B1FF|nr:hypothetical protein [Streptomyces griseorubiginosus]WUB46369.1 hypothetical protein OHN19_24755 [Streptomyces griseorubiginosus]WUB54890.1 hypothetical protein OG942_24760 [Streptomyces griseorubiginosus]